MGSMILYNAETSQHQYGLVRMTRRRMRVGLPCNVVADETETGDARIRLHDPTKRRLGILGHRVCFIKDDDFVRWRREVAS